MALQASPQGLKWFQDARFGLFIHWGLYAILAQQEWVMHTERIPVPEYEKLAEQFNPTRFNAEEWVSMAADAGQKYIVITSRHHDGFSMYDTALSEYKVTRTPFKRDPLAELANAVARRGDLKLGFYSSLLDWHHPAYRFRAESGLAWSDYVGFLHGQVRELCTNYGELACLWFDGDWPRHAITAENAYFVAGGSFEYDKLYEQIHTLQPHAVVINNHHTAPLAGEDVQGFEQDLPGMNSAGFNTTEVYSLPIEVCMTINDHWGYCAADQNIKSTRHLLHLLARSASVGGNFLLNVGPTAQGEIVPQQAERLRRVGAWLHRHAAAIYGTRAGQIPPTANYVSTQQDGRHYVHLLNAPSDEITLGGVPDGLSHAHLLHDGSAVACQRQTDQAVLWLPEDRCDPHNTVIVLS